MPTPTSIALAATLFLAAHGAWAAPAQFVHLLGAEPPVIAPAGEGAGDPQIERLIGAPADLWERVRQGFAIPELASPRVRQSEAWYASRPDVVNGMLSRARRYLHYVVERVERRGMPAEIALLPLVESGFNPMAVSSAAAVGLWQFIPATGVRYGLAQDDLYDARRDIIASTDAALDYLQFLHGMFQDWQLALAAYNWGENAVSRAIQANRARGGDGRYESLNMPEETRNYVPRLQAMKNLVIEPKRFGFELGEWPDEPHFTVKTIERPMTLVQAAGFAGMPLEDLRSLNPGWSSPHSAGPRHSLVLPLQKEKDFEAAYTKWLSSKPVAVIKAKKNRDRPYFSSTPSADHKK